MNFLKLLGRGLCSSLFRLSLFLLAMTATLIMIFGTSTVLKKSLADSGVYNSIVTGALESAQKEQGQKSGDIPLDRPEITAAIQTAFPSQFLQTSAEQLIDSIYGWLQGKTANPSFRIDLTGAKQRLTTSLGDYVATRAASLPACTPAQARGLQGSDIDPFNVSCLPPGVSAATIRQKVTTDLKNNNDFLKDPVLTEANLPKNDRGKTPFQQAEQAPKIYSKAKLVPYALVIVALLSAAGVILLHESRRRGLRSIGFSFLSVGIVVLISTWLVNYGMNRVKQPGGPLAKLSQNDLQQTLLTMVTKLTATLNNKLYIFCFSYILLGIGLLITLKLTAQKQLTTAAGVIDTPTATIEKDSGQKPKKDPIKKS